MSKHPYLLAGKSLPLLELSPDDFEDFTYQALSILGKYKGFEMLSGRQPSGDGGFDAIGKVDGSGDLICVQCKRYESAISSALVAHELTKVALNAKKDGYSVAIHYIISASTVANALRDHLKQEGYPKLLEKCQSLIADEKFKSQLKELKFDAETATQVVTEYVASLKNLIVWSADDFENELGVIWSQLNDVFEKYFTVHRVLKEYPRPDFDINQYISIHRKTNCSIVPLTLYKGVPPENFIVSKSNIRAVNITSFEALAAYLSVHQGLTIVTSPGGGGKSELFIYLFNKLLDQESECKVVPIRILLRSYLKGALDKTINQALGINFGTWKHLPHQFVFLFDGLDEMQSEQVQVFIDELQPIVNKYNIVISMRDTGLEMPVPVENSLALVKINQLSYRDVINIIKTSVQSQHVPMLNKALIELISLENGAFLKIPFGVKKFIEVFNETGKLSRSVNKILKQYVEARIERDRSRFVNSKSELNRLSAHSIKTLLSAICFEFRICRNLTAFPEVEYAEILAAAQNYLPTNDPVRKIGAVDLETIAKHFDLLRLGEDGLYSTEHDLVADWFAALTLGKNWQDFERSRSLISRPDTWLFASKHIEESDLPSFVRAIYNRNIILAAKVATLVESQTVTRLLEQDLLKSEQSDSILERGSAIIALGILATPSALERLRSEDNYLDNHHLEQRRRALMLSGDVELLKASLEPNEHLSTVASISGGSHDYWLSAPAMVITDISRDRLKAWSVENDIPLSMCLNIIARFGEDSDIPTLKHIVKGTSSPVNFLSAFKALQSISLEEFHTCFDEACKLDGDLGFLARKSACDLGLKIDPSLEWDTLVYLFERPEAFSLENSNQITFIENAFFVLKCQSLPDTAGETLIRLFKSKGAVESHFLLSQLWQLASDKKFPEFKVESENIFRDKSRPYYEYALRYVNDNVDQYDQAVLSEMLDLIFDEMNQVAENFRAKLSLGEAYLKLSKPEKAKVLLVGAVEECSAGCDIFARDYADDLMITFQMHCNGMLNLATKINPDVDADYVVALILMGFEKKNPNFDQLLNYISVEKMKECINKITDPRISLPLMTVFAVKNKIVFSEGDVFPHFDRMLDHHYYHKYLLTLSAVYWSDSYAHELLKVIFSRAWNSVSMQMFQRHIGEYSQLITKEQIGRFDGNLDNPEVLRIYKIWSEQAALID